MDSILIIDDEKDNLDALQRLLRSDYELTLKTSPFEALKELQKTEFSIIISDQRMPEMTGVELLEKAKQVNPSTTRILLTGYSDMDAVVGAINQGQVYHYIAKPWDPDELKLTLRQACEAFQLKKELEQKNRALTKSNQELKKTLESLRLLDRAKARFLSLISHELNTPLTVLTSFTELLEENKKNFSPDITKAVDSLSGATKKFSEIVSEVLLYVRLESENEFRLRDFNLEDETATLAEQLSTPLHTKQIHIALKASQNNILKCDPEKMRVALHKLMVHTIEQTPDGSPIKVTIERGPSEVSYSVWRLGPTLPDDGFSSLVPTQEPIHYHTGLGLRLAICKVIVEGHGGKMVLKESSSKGTEIALVFPT